MSKKKTFILVFDPGPEWEDELGVEEQNYWIEHTRFADKLFEEGKIIITGPTAHHDRIVMIYESESESKIRITFSNDPLIKNGILSLESIMEWNIRLDQRNK